MQKFRVNQIFAGKYPNAITQVNGVRVALCGNDIQVEKPGTDAKAPEKFTVKAATQAQLKYLYEVEKHPAIEAYEEKEK